MSLAAGSRLGPYEIVSPLGAGGMGEVYRARDTRLERTVAVKVLPSHLSASPEARQRLEREARAISKLSHPHICALHDVGRDGETDFLVMELLEGETLSSRLASGPLPPAETVRLGVQIAEALDAAHRQGIVHRDLKPGNVMLTKAGAKLLDFGLAKAVRPLVQGPEWSESPTASVPADLTLAGSILGTLQYMAPEQLAGKPADARSDIFALGAVLYEMASGRRAFAGTSPATIASAILGSEPAAVAAVTPALDRLLRTCLAKDPEKRWQSAHDVSLQLRTIGEVSVAETASRPPSPPGRDWKPWALAAATTAVALASLLRPAAPDRPWGPPVRFPVLPPAGLTFSLDTVETVTLALSPDGSQLAFVAREPGAAPRLFLRPLSALEAKPLEGTEGASSAFWSPDGRALAFFARGKLKRLDLASGAIVPLCDVPDAVLYGTWGGDGQILFAAIDGEAIYRVSTAGGPPVPEIKAAGEARATWPQFLPDGRSFLYLARALTASGAELMLARPGAPPQLVGPMQSVVQYVDPGFLVFGREGTLLAQRFDPASGRLSGDPFSVAEPVLHFSSNGWTAFSASRSGALAFASAADTRRLAWIDRSGRELSTIGTLANNERVRISPDGGKAVFDRTQPQTGTWDLWSLDLGREIETRLTSDPGTDVTGVWLPDGQAVLFSKPRQGIFRRHLATGTEDELLPGVLLWPEDVSPDGKLLVFNQRAERGNADLWTLRLDGERKPAPLFETPFDETGARFSPDGRFLSFRSNESGRYEVYITPFPPTAARTRISTGGTSSAARWDRRGREIFYLSADGRLVSVPLRTSPALALGAASPLFSFTGKPWRSFDVSADGKRFLAIVPEVVAAEQPLTVLLNWTSGIGR